MIKNIKSILTKDEKILHDSRAHWIVFAKPAVLAVIGFAVGIFFHPLVGGLILFMNCYIVYISVVFYKTTHLILTEKKVIGRTGFMSRNWSQLNLSHIETAYLQEPVIGRWLGYSSVIIRGTGVGSVAFPYLLDGEIFIRKLEKFIAANEDKERENIINITLPSSESAVEEAA